MRVLMYCDVGDSVGLGHLMRCLTLAGEAVRQGWRVELAGVFDERAITIAAQLVPEAQLHSVAGSDPLRELHDLTAELRPEVVHLDSYDPRLERFAERFGGLVSNMQDGAFGVRPAGLTIDANLYAEKEPVAFCVAAARLLGIDAVLIRDQVHAAKCARTELRVIELDDRSLTKVLIVLGGTDPNRATARVLDAMSALSVEVDLTVVAPSVEHEALLPSLALVPGTAVLHGFVADLPALAAHQDLVITAAGTSVWDFAFLGVPMALLAVVDNQMVGYESALRAGIARGIGDATNLDPAELCDVVEALLADTGLREELSARGMQLVDGLGAWRAVSAWEQLLRVAPVSVETGKLTVREVSRADAETLFAWRNDPVTRIASRHSGPVLWSEHQHWLEHSLEARSRRLLIVEDADHSVATVRWDRLELSRWEVSVTVSPDYRGRGIAGAALALAEEALRTDAEVRGAGAVGLLAEIHSDNLASAKVFARAGYLPHKAANKAGFIQMMKWVAVADDPAAN